MMTLRATAGAAVAVLVAAGLGACAGDAEPAPTPTATSGVRVTVPQEQAPTPTANGGEASATAVATPTPADTEAVGAAGRVVLALACGDNSADLASDLDGDAARTVPAELEDRASMNEQLMDRMGTTMHAQLLDGDWLTVHNDDQGMVLMVYTVSWEAPPDQETVPETLRRARPGDPGVTAWAVTLTADDDGAWRVVDVAAGSRADPD